jgi:adenosylcobinamide-GDP ribazoletransferase
LKKSIKYIPLFSFVSGGIIFISYYASKKFLPHPIPEFFTISIQYLLFNYFHFDGLLDFSDAFLSHKKNREDILKIMEDTKIGSFAVLVGVIYLLTKIELYQSLLPQNPKIIIFSFSAGRLGILASSFLFPKPAKSEGLGYIFLSAGRKIFFVPCIIFFSINFYFFPYETVFSTLSSAAIGFLSLRRINGLTGDVLGAICEISEIVFLTTNFAIKSVSLQF